MSGRISFFPLEQQKQWSWNECEIKSEYDEAGKRPWNWAPCRFCGAMRWGQARLWLISVSKCSHKASTTSHTTPIISLHIRRPCVSIYEVLFKLWEAASVWACWHLSPCVCQCCQYLIVLWRSSSCHVWMVGGEGPGYMRIISLRWHPAEGDRNASVGAILWPVIVCKVCKIG